MRILILSIMSLCTAIFAWSAQPKEQANMATAKPRTRTHAQAKITVQNSEAKPYDQTAARH